MTAFIPQISSRPTLKALGIDNMFKSLIYRLKEMDESLNRLIKVAKLPLPQNTKQDCIEYVRQQYKLIEIAQDLRKRLSHIRLMSTEQLKIAYKRNFLQKTIQEVNLLFEMHFRVKKSYITLIDKYYEKTVTQEQPLMVA